MIKCTPTERLTLHDAIAVSLERFSLSSAHSCTSALRKELIRSHRVLVQNPLWNWLLVVIQSAGLSVNSIEMRETHFWLLLAPLSRKSLLKVLQNWNPSCYVMSQRALIHPFASQEQHLLLGFILPCRGSNNTTTLAGSWQQKAVNLSKDNEQWGSSPGPGMKNTDRILGMTWDFF